MKFKIWPLAALAGMALAGCGTSGGGDGATTTTTTGSTPTASKPADGSKPLVAFSQANSKDPWRQVFDAETKTEVDKDASLFTFEEQAADDDADKQKSQIETVILKQPKVLLVCPSTIAVGAETDKVFDQKIPVILMDRGVPGDKYTCYIGGDNVEIGRQAGEYIAKRLNGKGTVLMIQGLGGVDAAKDRQDGAMESFKKYPGITTIIGDDCKFQRQDSHNYMDTFLQTRKPFDAVYAHNDEMAIGAYDAWEAWSKSQPGAKKPIFVGIDGCQKEVVNMIKDGKLDATLKYPIPGPMGVQIAADILKGKMPEKKRILLPTELVTKETADKYLAANPNLAK